MGLLASGQAELCIAGGVEFCSDQPIRYPRVVRQLLMKGPRARTQEAQLEVAGLAKNFNAKAFLPELVDPREFSSNEVMGEFKEIEIIHRLFLVIAMYCQASSSQLYGSLNLPCC